MIDPKGIAVHYIRHRIFWVDVNVSSQNSVLRSCDFEGKDFKEVFVYREVGNTTVSVNATDLVLNFYQNDTAYIIDQVSCCLASLYVCLSHLKPLLILHP